MSNEDRGKFRRDLTRVLTEAYNHLELRADASVQVKEYIEHYEFRLAYELIMYELREKEVPADAAASLKAAALRMGLQNSN
jgi:hypothetical protein